VSTEREHEVALVQRVAVGLRGWLLLAVSDGDGVGRARQLVNERVGVVRQPVSAPGNVLVGTHQRVIAAVELAGFGLGEVRERQREAALAGGREEPVGVFAAAAQA